MESLPSEVLLREVLPWIPYETGFPCVNTSVLVEVVNALSLTSKTLARACEPLRLRRVVVTETTDVQDLTYLLKSVPRKRSHITKITLECVSWRKWCKNEDEADAVQKIATLFTLMNPKCVEVWRGYGRDPRCLEVALPTHVLLYIVSNSTAVDQIILEGLTFSRADLSNIMTLLSGRKLQLLSLGDCKCISPDFEAPVAVRVSRCQSYITELDVWGENDMHTPLRAVLEDLGLWAVKSVRCHFRDNTRALSTLLNQSPSLCGLETIILSGGVRSFSSASQLGLKQNLATLLDSRGKLGPSLKNIRFNVGCQGSLVTLNFCFGQLRFEMWEERQYCRLHVPWEGRKVRIIVRDVEYVNSLWDAVSRLDTLLNDPFTRDGDGMDLYRRLFPGDDRLEDFQEQCFLMDKVALVARERFSFRALDWGNWCHILGTNGM